MGKIGEKSLKMKVVRLCLLLVFLFSIINFAVMIIGKYQGRELGYYPCTLFGAHVLFMLKNNISLSGVPLFNLVEDMLGYLRLIGFDNSTVKEMADFIINLYIPEFIGHTLVSLIIVLPLVFLCLSGKHPVGAFKSGAVFYAMDTVAMLLFYAIPSLFHVSHYGYYSEPQLTFLRISLACLLLRFVMLGVLVWGTVPDKSRDVS